MRGRRRRWMYRKPWSGAGTGDGGPLGRPVSMELASCLPTIAGDRGRALDVGLRISSVC